MGVFESFPPIAIGVCLILATASVFAHAGWCVHDEVGRLRRVETELSQDEAEAQGGTAEASNDNGIHGSDEEYSETHMLPLSTVEATQESVSPADIVVHEQGGGSPAIDAASKEMTASSVSSSQAWDMDAELMAAALCGGVEPLPEDTKRAPHISDASTTALVQRMSALAEKLATNDAMQYADRTALAVHICGVAKELAAVKAKEATDKAEAWRIALKVLSPPRFRARG